MPNPWYELVEAQEFLSQEDIIEDCPILEWSAEDLDVAGVAEDEEELEGAVEAVVTDAIVMTQACDLEQDKVDDVILCSCYPLEEYREHWGEWMRNREQNPTDNSWASHCRNINRGYIWNLSVINSGAAGEDDLETPHRVVDFQEIHRIRRGFLEELLESRGEPRFRLLPPYREHLSQSFARYFMRVGLPEDVDRIWQQEGN